MHLCLIRTRKQRIKSENAAKWTTPISRTPSKRLQQEFHGQLTHPLWLFLPVPDADRFRLLILPAFFSRTFSPRSRLSYPRNYVIWQKYIFFTKLFTTMFCHFSGLIMTMLFTTPFKRSFKKSGSFKWIERIHVILKLLLLWRQNLWNTKISFEKQNTSEKINSSRGALFFVVLRSVYFVEKPPPPPWIWKFARCFPHPRAITIN